MKTNFLKLSVMSLMVLSSTLAIARGPHHGHGPKGGGPGTCLLSDPSMTSEQKAQIQKLQTDFENQVSSLRTQMQSFRQEMQKLWLADSLDTRAIEDLDAQMKPLREQLHQARLAHRLSVAQVLTVEQRKQFHSSMKGRGFGDGPRGMHKPQGLCGDCPHGHAGQTPNP